MRPFGAEVRRMFAWSLLMSRQSETSRTRKLYLPASKGRIFQSAVGVAWERTLAALIRAGGM